MNYNALKLNFLTLEMKRTIFTKFLTKQKSKILLIP